MTAPPLKDFHEPIALPLRTTTAWTFPFDGVSMIAQATGMAAARPPHVRVRIYLKQASLFAADLPDEHPWPIPREYGTTSDLEHMSPKA